eukprot:3392194-Amphidinium_carterae.1
MSSTFDIGLWTIRLSPLMRCGHASLHTDICRANSWPNNRSIGVLKVISRCERATYVLSFGGSL